MSGVMSEVIIVVNMSQSGTVTRPSSNELNAHATICGPCEYGLLG
eukprot:CAMPEP_0198291640 /NCGR_PEP_ID=MMETSP1449-20131203/9111_1 /TAXON_ID=420275 /ORGANISM="Attheya septentrionalis, Strain CCMP2084" /LENGTH=44 /DNA_ID= /DNA_START= /DNA_END= /DNA_ORIENTATION=